MQQSPNSETGLVPTQRLADQYRKLTHNTAEAIVKLGEIVVQVKKHGDESLRWFCEAVKLDPKGSTYRKRVEIGNKAERLRTCIDKLPPSWTTIYDLARLSDDDFDKVAASGKLDPSITAKDIRQIVRPTKPDSSPAKDSNAVGGEQADPVLPDRLERHQCDADDQKATVTLDFSDLSPEDRTKALREIETLGQTYGFALHLSDAMRAAPEKPRPEGSNGAAFQMEQPA